MINHSAVHDKYFNDIEIFSQDNLKGKAEYGIVLHYDLNYVNIPYIHNMNRKNNRGKGDKMLSACL